jgi:hypothetical protein
MKRQSQDVFITEVASSNLVKATIYDDISEENLSHYREQWQPTLKAVRQQVLESRSQGKTVANPVEDAHWDWERKVLAVKGSLNYLNFAIERDATTQGLMQLELTMHRSRSKQGQHLVYLSYLSVAPWNRKVLGLPIYKGIGSIFLAQAVGTSMEEGFGGRVGLHALPSAAGWYRKHELVSFGSDVDYQNLEYFEMGEAGAKKFVQRLDE